MRPTTTIILFVLLFTIPEISTGKDTPPQKIADEKLQKLIDESIDRGAEWLAGTQAPNGSFAAELGQPLGGTALSVLALLHSGMAPDHDVIRRAFEFMRILHRASGSSRHTYSASVSIMALAEYRRARGELSKEDRDWLASLVTFLLKSRTAGGAWRYPGPRDGFDNSNTQYALLALKEARRSGVPVPEEVFAKVLTHFISRQERRGAKVRRSREEGGDGVYSANRRTVAGYDYARGWGYIEPQGVTGSMTAAGTAAVAICLSELQDRRWRSLIAAGEKAMWDGIAWLGKNFSVRDNPRGNAGWHYYYLYGLERAGVLAGVVYMAGHRWYAEGAKYLVDAQSPDGSWRVPSAMRGGRQADPVTQAFALLFLARATARSMAVATEEPLVDLTGAGELGDEGLRNLFKAAFVEMVRLEGDALTKRAGEFRHLGPRVVPLLLTRLTADELELRARAILILREITGRSKGFDPRAGEPARQAAVDRWISWYLGNRPAGLLR